MGPHDVAFNVDEGLRRTTPEAVAIFHLELIAEIERLIAWRKHDGGCDSARRLYASAVYLLEYLGHCFVVATGIDSISQILLSPDNRALDIDKRGDGAAAKSIAILRLEIDAAKAKWLITWREFRVGGSDPLISAHGVHAGSVRQSRRTENRSVTSSAGGVTTTRQHRAGDEKCHDRCQFIPPHRELQKPR